MNKLEIIKSLAKDAQLVSLRQAEKDKGKSVRLLRYHITQGNLPFLRIDRDYYILLSDLEKIQDLKPGKKSAKVQKVA